MLRYLSMALFICELYFVFGRCIIKKLKGEYGKAYGQN